MPRTIALCYIRQSRTLDKDDTNSPLRQRANIEIACQQMDWQPEWYEEVGGHRSGTSEDNRPEWIALKNRIGDPDVVAVVANDSSRLHRNLASVADMLDALERHEVKLYYASIRSEVDVSTLTGQMYAQLRGLMDAFYAKDIAIKARDSIRYRKNQNKTVGRPPFGLARNKEGYHIPSDEGAWLLPDGTFQAGEIGDEPPHSEAVWRGYYTLAEKILRMFVERNIGRQRIAYELNQDGWAFRNRKGKPRPLNEDDIRRVLTNWAGYGGLVLDKPAKDRKPHDYDLENTVLSEERAVFPLDLLYDVARTLKERSFKKTNRGENRKVYPYVLGGLLICAHCIELTAKHNDPSLVSRLGGSRSRGKQRYRHLGGRKCGTTTRSVDCAELDADFGRLIKLLSVKPEALELMTELAILSDKNYSGDAENVEDEKRAQIALHQRKIDAAINLYRDGILTREEYLHDVEVNQRQIAHWQARTTETEQLAIEMTMCMHAVEAIETLWEGSDDSERQELVRTLFSEITYNLDTRRIVHFKLKAWADRFLQLRCSLHQLYEEFGGEDDQDASGNGANLTVDTLRQGLGSNPLNHRTLNLDKSIFFYYFEYSRCLNYFAPIHLNETHSSS